MTSATASTSATVAYDTADAGAYEVLRDRLAAQSADLARRAELLNARRVEEFGSARLELASTERLRTEHPGVPRDLAVVGDALLLGSTGRPGGGSSRATAVADVFTLYDRDLNPLPESAVPGLLDDPAFVREFADLHRYYRQARLLRLRPVGGRLLAVFRTGEKADDIRVLRWELTEDGRAAFLDARGERDDVFPPAHDFEWTAATREDHVLGRHPHVSVRGEFHVSAVGGALTVKLEDDTETAEGVYSEPVDEPLQSLADADIAHARVGALILLRVRPYKEDTDRHLVFNTLTKSVVRLDGIGPACRRLPDDQGIVFPGGYCLATGAHKTYELDAEGLEFEREVRSPNGEDVLYAFHARGASRGLLLSYNTIRKEVANPLPCRGWALAEDGTFTVLRADGDEPAQVHPVQLWHSPYVSDTHAAAAPAGSGPLARVGNADLVRGISACLSVAGAVGEGITTAEGYRALAASCVRAADAHHWLGEADLGDLAGALAAVRETAEQVLAEFETVRDLTRRAAEARDAAAERIASVVRRLRGEAPKEAAAWVRGLTELRHAHGHLLTVKELRYADAPGIDALAEEAEASLAELGRRAVAFLAREDAFDAQRADVEALVADAEAIATVAEAGPVAARLDELADGLRTVTDVVAELDMGDATVRTALLERVAGVLGGVNRARATLDARRRALLDREGRAEFTAETALLGQAVTAALAAADTPERCDDQLARLLARLEDLESRFAEFDGFLAELADKRTEIYDALAARKQSLSDTRARRAEQLAASAARIMETVVRRCAALADADAVSTYFASDPMPAKVRRTAEELRALGDTVRAEELDGRLKSARQEAARALRDRTDLYDDDGRTLRLGAHRFAVNTQPLDLTLVPDGDGLAFALTGTDYRSPVTDPDFAATRAHWGRTLPSESPGVYRAEHLAARLLREHGASALAAADDLPALVREAAQEAYDEGYERGVHDHDATAVLNALLPLYDRAGTLVHEPAARAAAQLFWAHGTTPRTRESWTRRARSLARARDTFGLSTAVGDLEEELAGGHRRVAGGRVRGPEETPAGAVGRAGAGRGPRGNGGRRLSGPVGGDRRGRGFADGCFRSGGRGGRGGWFGDRGGRGDRGRFAGGDGRFGRGGGWSGRRGGRPSGGGRAPGRRSQGPHGRRLRGGGRDRRSSGRRARPARRAVGLRWAACPRGRRVPLPRADRRPRRLRSRCRDAHAPGEVPPHRGQPGLRRGSGRGGRPGRPGAARRGVDLVVRRRHRRRPHPRRPGRGGRRRALPGPAPLRRGRPADGHGRGPAGQPPARQGRPTAAAPRRVPRPYRPFRRARRPRVPRLPAASYRPGGRRTGPPAPGRPPSARHVRLRPQPPRGRGLPAARRRQPGQAARRHRRRQAHRHRRPAAAPVPARLRQDDPGGVRRRTARPDAGEGRRPRARPRRHLARPGRRPERHRAPGGREDQLRAGGREQHAALPGRHPAHLTRAAPEVHPAVRRHPPRGRRVGRPPPHLRPARQALRRLHGRQPLHRVRRPLPGPRHARQPGRRLEPGRRPHRQGGRLRAELPGERAHRQPGPGPAGRP
ncbi:DNA repair ATPase [Streptomyces sp. RS2]|nr:DNA repair ATPase [Streptomyces sp. RS2]